jgi:hypothetical protein
MSIDCFTTEGSPVSVDGLICVYSANTIFGNPIFNPYQQWILTGLIGSRPDQLLEANDPNNHYSRIYSDAGLSSYAVDYRRSKDLKSYGNWFSGLSLLGNSSKRDCLHENGLDRTNHRGTYITSNSVVFAPLNSYYSPTFIDSSKVVYQPSVLCSDGSSRTLYQNGVAVGSYKNRLYVDDIRFLLEANLSRKLYFENYQFVSNQIQPTLYSLTSFSISPSTISLYYTFSIFAPDSSFEAIRLGTATLTGTGWTDLSYILSTFKEVASYSCTNYGTTISRSNQQWTAGKTYGTFLKVSAATKASTTLMHNSLIKKGAFGKYWNSRLPDIRPSSFYYFVDAIENLRITYSDNLIETLYDMISLYSLIPLNGTRGLIELLSDVIFHPKKVIKLLRVISDEYLRAIFGYLPLKDQLDDILAKYEQVGKQFYTLAGTGYTVYGSRVFQLDSKTALTTSSKVRVRIEPNSVLNMMLALDSNGLLPLPSRLWDLIPFSFVADWFTGMSDRLRSAEIYAFSNFFTFDYLIHSYWVMQDNSASFPLLTAVTPVTSSWYRRELSRIIPRPQDSPFNFDSQPVRVNYLTAGSLIVSVT